MHQAKLLQSVGQQLSIYILQGFIFFGTANQLLNQIRQPLQQTNPSPRFLLLDFRLVRGLDTSAMMSLIKLQQLCDQHNCVLVLTHLSSTIQHQLTRYPTVNKVLERCQIFPDLDRGVEWCEDQLIAASAWRRQRTLPLAMQLKQQLGSPDTAKVLMSYLKEIKLEANAVVFKQHEPAQALYFIQSGQISTFRHLDNDHAQRIQTIGANNLLGERDFYQQTNYFTSAIADQPTTLFRLSTEDWQQLQQDHLTVANQFQTWMLSQLSDQLTSAYQEIENLLH
jgi:sulfate permease, SulP family